MPELEPNPNRVPKKVNEDPEKAVKGFNGVIIGGVFMSARPDLGGPIERAELAEKIDKISKHLS